MIRRLRFMNNDFKVAVLQLEAVNNLDEFLIKF